MRIGNIIKEYRLNHDLSMQAFADKCGLSKGYISMLEKGRHPQNNKEIIPSIDTVQKVASAMGITVDKLLEMVDANQPIEIAKDDPSPLYEAAAGEGRLNDGYPTETISFSLDDDQVAVRVVGRSMEPTLYDGDCVIVTATNIIDYPRQIALVRVNGDEATIKRVEIKENGVMLMGDNFDVYPPHFYTEDEVQQLPVEIQGVVTRLIREIK